MQPQVDLDAMRERLREQQKMLDKQIEVEQRKLVPTGTANPDQSDLASDYAYRSHQMSILERLETQLAEVKGALKRIEKGTYGICTNCGNAIMPERLEALPYAELCIDCQRKEQA